jgi:hypothetical protein
MLKQLLSLAPAAALFAFSPAVPCQQPQPLEAPAALLEHYSLRTGTVQDLYLPARGEAGFRVEVVIDGAVRTLELAAHDVRTADFRLLLDDGKTLQQLATPPSVTFRGQIQGMADSAVAATLVGGQLEAVVLLDDRTMWGIQPANKAIPALPATTHVVYRAHDVETPGVHCGVHHDAAPVDAPGTPGPQALKIAEIAVDADLEYYQRNGSNSTNVNNAVTAVINGMNVIYKRDTEIEHNLTTIIIRTTAIYNWNGDLCQLLSDFRNYWNANHGSVRRDLAHIFTGKGAFSGVVGCAYLTVVCNLGAAYGSSKAYHSSLTTNVGLVSHECGHNWSAGHCDSSPPCYIMCSGLGGCQGNLTLFGPTSINSIVNHKNSRTCLDDGPPPGPPTIANLSPSSVTSWQPALVTITGTNLSSVTSVTVGGSPATINSQVATSLVFTPRSPFDIATHPVVATNPVGSSAPRNLTVTGNHPSVMVLGPFWFRGINASINLYSDRNWQSALFFSPDNTPSSLPGIISMGIGNAFQSLIYAGGVFHGNDGSAFKSVYLPLSLPTGITLYWQAASIDNSNPTLPIEVSNVGSRVII